MDASSPAGKKLCDLRPPVAQALLRLADGKVLLGGPRISLDGGVQLVLEALSALLAAPTGQLRGDHGPLAPSVHAHQQL